MPDIETRMTAISCRIRPVSRRHFVGAATGALAAPVLAGTVAGQNLDATPALGSPSSNPDIVAVIDAGALLALSEALVGGGQLNQDAVNPLALLIGSDPARVSGFEELTRLEDPATREALENISGDAARVVNDILQYWYLGYFEDQPVENRAELFFGLPVWGTVPYFTQPTLCKGFGYWATEVDIAE